MMLGTIFLHRPFQMDNFIKVIASVEKVSTIFQTSINIAVTAQEQKEETDTWQPLWTILWSSQQEANFTQPLLKWRNEDLPLHDLSFGRMGFELQYNAVPAKFMRKTFTSAGWAGGFSLKHYISTVCH